MIPQHEPIKSGYVEILEEDKEKSGYAVSYPDLPGCITCGETIEVALDSVEHSKRDGISMN